MILFGSEGEESSVKKWWCNSQGEDNACREIAPSIKNRLELACNIRDKPIKNYKNEKY